MVDRAADTPTSSAVTLASTLQRLGELLSHPDDVAEAHDLLSALLDKVTLTRESPHRTRSPPKSIWVSAVFFWRLAIPSNSRICFATTIN
jgi:hypothetical protein